MTVYELIQELTRYKPDTEVDFHIEGNFSVETEVEFDREDEDDVQSVTADVDIVEDVEFDGISDKEHDGYIVIDLCY